jgi:hypothetical protein
LEVKTKIGHDNSLNSSFRRESINTLRKSINRELQKNKVKSKAFIESENSSGPHKMYDESEVDDANFYECLTSPVKKIATLNLGELNKSSLFPKSSKF